MMPRRMMQAHKVYVQDRLRESGELVWRLLTAGAHFYVCGDAAHMAGAVEEALVSIIEGAQVRGASHMNDTSRSVLSHVSTVHRLLLHERAEERLKDAEL